MALLEILVAGLLVTGLTAWSLTRNPYDKRVRRLPRSTKVGRPPDRPPYDYDVEG